MTRRTGGSPINVHLVGENFFHVPVTPSKVTASKGRAHKRWLKTKASSLTSLSGASPVGTGNGRFGCRRAVATFSITNLISGGEIRAESGLPCTPRLSTSSAAVLHASSTGLEEVGADGERHWHLCRHPGGTAGTPTKVLGLVRVHG